MAPYLTLCREVAVQQDYALRDVFNALRYIVKTGNRIQDKQLLLLHPH